MGAIGHLVIPDEERLVGSGMADKAVHKRGPVIRAGRTENVLASLDGAYFTECQIVAFNSLLPDIELGHLLPE